jgi:hypothetical protein
MFAHHNQINMKQKIKDCLTFAFHAFFRVSERNESVNWAELLTESMPLPDQIKDFTHVCHGAVYFTWRQNRYKIETKTVSVWLVDGPMLTGEDSSILIEHILKSKLKMI